MYASLSDLSLIKMERANEELRVYVITLSAGKVSPASYEYPLKTWDNLVHVLTVYSRPSPVL